MLRTAFYSRAGAALEFRADSIVVCHDLLCMIGFMASSGREAVSPQVCVSFYLSGVSRRRGPASSQACPSPSLSPSVRKEVQL